MSSTTVRVGIHVTRHESKYIPFRYHMFYCRKKDKGDAKYVATADWMESVIDCMPHTFELDEVEKIPVGGSRRYWVHMTVTGWCDYWGEYDEEVVVHKVRPCGKITK